MHREGLVVIALMCLGAIRPAVAADADTLDLESDEALSGRDLFTPGIRKIGAFAGAAALAAPHPLLLHNMGRNFSTGLLRDVYAAAKAQKMLREEEARLPEDSLAEWLTQ